MTIKPDRWIRRMALEQGMIEPFVDRQVRTVRTETGQERGVISFGLSSYGYDVRLADEFRIFTPGLGDLAVVDPKRFDERALVQFQGQTCLIPPNSFVLARTFEYFRIPRNVMTLCVGKSSLARCGIIVNVTPFEPEWRGYATLQLCNTAPLPAKIYAHEGVAQVLFLEGDPPDHSYADKQGKYQGQTGVTLPRL